MLIRLKRCTGFIMLLLLTINSIFLTNIYANKNSLTTPEVILFTVFGDSLFFEWKAVDGATSYDVKIDGIISTTTKAYFVFENIDTTKNYTFSIMSKNANYISNWSQTSSIIANSFEPKARYSIAQDGTIEGKFTLKPAANLMKPARMDMDSYSLSASTQNTYIIRTVDDLNNIRNDLFGHYVLANDIDLQGEYWEPIGDEFDYDSHFSGILDGKGHTINNISANNAFFGGTSNATIKNLSFENASVSIPAHSGILIGGMYNGIISNCSIIDSSISGYIGVGGLIGYSVGNGTIENSFVAVRVSGRFGDGLEGTHTSNILNSYCNSDLLEYDEDYSYKDCARTTNQLKMKSTFVGWNFENVWDIQEGVSYPYLRKQSQTGSKETDINAAITTGNDIIIALTAKDVESISSNIFTLTYNVSELALADFAAQTKALDVSAGAIAGTDLEIISHENGVIKFKLNKTTVAGQKWSGVLSAVKFKAKTAGQSIIKFEQ